MSEAPLITFGLLADIQYADKNMVSFDGRPQRYRESLAKLSDALADFTSRCSSSSSSSSPETSQPLACVLTLGDIIDGYKGDSLKTSMDLQLVASMFDNQLPRGLPSYHTLGNHECLTAGRQELLKALHMPHSYYSVPLATGWRLVVLDTTEMSLHSGYPADSPQMQQARQWAASHPLHQYPNAQSWNGGCTQQQLDWLCSQLSEARQAKEHVVVACHHPIAPGSAPDMYLAWGNDQLLSVLCGSAGAGTVRAVFSGHYHPGGYVQREGIHFVVLEGVLEAPSNSNAYAVVELYPSGVLKIAGSGVATSRQLL